MKRFLAKMFYPHFQKHFCPTCGRQTFLKDMKRLEAKQREEKNKSYYIKRRKP